MKACPARLLAFTEGHPPQKRARSITTTEVTSRDPRSGLVIAAIHPVFVSTRGRFTATRARPRACGGPAITIMHPVNSGAGILVMGGIGGVPGITETKDPPLRVAVIDRRANRSLRSARCRVRSDAPNKKTIIRLARVGHQTGSKCASPRLRKIQRALIVAAAWSILSWSTHATAQRLADRQNSAAPASAATLSIIATDG
jgi:hypothetical protein